MNTGKFEDMYNLLTQNNFDVNGNLPSDMKCLKCRKILNNACQGPCGCQFCLICLNEFMDSGCSVCPGTTDECSQTNLSIFHTDFKMNRRISKLVVRCPEEMCSYESELINVYDHLRICPNKSLKCVFQSLGCDVEKLASPKMNEHLQLESDSHMRMLMNVVDNMRNEIGRLKENDLKNRSEIGILKENDARNMDEIAILKERDTRKQNEIALLKQELLIKEKRMIPFEEEVKSIKVR